MSILSKHDLQQSGKGHEKSCVFTAAQHESSQVAQMLPSAGEEIEFQSFPGEDSLERVRKTPVQHG